MKWAILIATLESRRKKYERLLTVLRHQIKDHPVDIISSCDNGEFTTGYKRNQLLDMANKTGATYISFFDDDDLPGKNYIERNMEGIRKGVDCNSLTGSIYFGSKQGNPFYHSLKYERWTQDNKGYYRNPNHLNVIKLSCLDGIRFKDQTIGEDGHFSIALNETKVLKTQHVIDEVIYHYFCRPESRRLEESIYKSLME